MGLLVSKAVFQPPSPSYDIDYRSYTTIGSKHGYSIPITCIFHKKPQIAIMYSHGNAEDLGQVHSWCEVLSRELNATVFSYDYQGYGPMKGYSPSERNVFSDVVSVYEYINKFYKHDQIVLFGRSLGCAPSIKAALTFPKCRALILESPFLSCVKTVCNTKFTFWFDMFRNEVNLKQCSVPTLIIHGKCDTVVPFYHGLTLYHQCQCASDFLWLEHAGHNNIDTTYRDELFHKLKFFLVQYEEKAIGKKCRKRK